MVRASGAVCSRFSDVIDVAESRQNRSSQHRGTRTSPAWVNRAYLLKYFLPTLEPTPPRWAPTSRVDNPTTSSRQARSAGRSIAPGTSTTARSWSRPRLKGTGRDDLGNDGQGWSVGAPPRNSRAAALLYFGW